MNPAVQAVLRDLRGRMERLFGERLVEVRLFGSRARGDERPDSDYDVLILLRGPTDASQERARASHDIADLCLEHDVVISYFLRGEAEVAHSDEPFLQNALREGVVL